MVSYRGAAVYVFRTRRPGLIGRLPVWLPGVAFGISFWALLLLGYPAWPALLAFLFNPRHFAYVGETTAVNLRKVQHLEGGGFYRHVAKPWADLEPSFYYLRMPAKKWVLRSVETLVMLLLWPVYNKQKNLWNPRRIPLQAAKVQRASRDRIGWSVNFRLIHLAMLAAIVMIGVTQ